MSKTFKGKVTRPFKIALSPKKGEKKGEIKEYVVGDELTTANEAFFNSSIAKKRIEPIIEKKPVNNE